MRRLGLAAVALLLAHSACGGSSSDRIAQRQAIRKMLDSSVPIPDGNLFPREPGAVACSIEAGGALSRNGSVWFVRISGDPPPRAID